MFRHGARSWIQSYPNEMIPVSYWDADGGLGQLTSIGKQQLKSQGEHFRKMYATDFGKEFNPMKVVARSTDFARTIASTAAFLSAVFTQPIPIITAPLLNDTVKKNMIILK